ncbi:MAG: Uncharacterized protein FD138_3859 [Planctomycetota bacterium]|nr:MAG: Uncharacterized protein FD138_3859 [Planctomycetota bacterium]
MTALLGPQDVAGSADFQIAHRDLEAGSEFAEFFDRLQPLRRERSQRLALFQKQIAVRLVLVPADSPAKLMQVCESIILSVIDEDRVRVRDVDTAFDDRCADEDVELAVHELDHDLFEFVPLHLPVPDPDASFRHDPLNPVGHRLDVVDAIVNEEDLAIAIEFPHDRLPNQIAVEPADARRHRHAINGCRRQIADVSNPQQRHVQRARDRRRAERQHIHFQSQVFQNLFVLDAEALLLVDDQQAEVFEPHVR